MCFIESLACAARDGRQRIAVDRHAEPGLLLEQLLEASGRENFSEVRWLEAEIRDTQALLP